MTGLGTVRLLEAIRETGVQTKFYRRPAAKCSARRLRRKTKARRFMPRSPYAAQRCMLLDDGKLSRRLRLFACNGILFNHESPRRGETFVSPQNHEGRSHGSSSGPGQAFLGNLDARRDWGYAGDYVEAMWTDAPTGRPDDYVIATGEAHSVRDFLDEAFGHLDLDWQKYVEIDPRYYRPTEVDLLLGDASKAQSKARTGQPKVRSRNWYA